jgi:hypothetical protein
MIKAGGNTRPLIFLAILWWLMAAAVVLYQVAMPPEIQIEWVTATEYNTAGFNLYRSETPDGEYRQVNESLIPSNADPALGGYYLYLDREVMRRQNYYYVLEDVEYDNTRQRHPAITGRAAAVEGWSLLIAALSGLVGFRLLALARSNKPSRPE